MFSSATRHINYKHIFSQTHQPPYICDSLFISHKYMQRISPHSSHLFCPHFGCSFTCSLSLLCHYYSFDTRAHVLVSVLCNSLFCHPFLTIHNFAIYFHIRCQFSITPQQINACIVLFHCVNLQRKPIIFIHCRILRMSKHFSMESSVSLDLNSFGHVFVSVFLNPYQCSQARKTFFFIITILVRQRCANIV